MKASKTSLYPPQPSVPVRTWMRLGSLCGCLLLPVWSAPALAADISSRPLAGMEKALLDGRADAAAAGLQPILSANPSNGFAHLLLCRVWLSEGLATQAVEECQAALANGLERDSTAQDWTGRALGAQAQHAGLLKGMKLAFGVRNAFEAAVNLNPTSEAACVDLGEYYTSAPAIVGGGSEKALALAARIQNSLPAVAHRIRAMNAEKEKDFSTAEQEFRDEVAASRNPGTLVDLAAFYGRRHQDGMAIAAARETLAADREHDATVVEAAGVLGDAHQGQLAAAAMRDYLAHGDRSDIAPAFRVHTMLGTFLASSGEKDAARAQYEQALALASHYAPAQKGLGAL
ncbi:MAG: tetratricopeptide repeat protein [Janthinobacterium lividum]